jgi:hypothetical protein
LVISPLPCRCSATILSSSSLETISRWKTVNCICEMLEFLFGALGVLRIGLVADVTAEQGGRSAGATPILVGFSLHRRAFPTKSVFNGPPVLI